MNATDTNFARDSAEGRSMHDRGTQMQTVPWQSVRDEPERRLMVQRIIALTEARRALREAQGRLATVARMENTAEFARKMELVLYHRANSLREYKNAATLQRRLESLISSIFQEVTAATRAHRNGQNDVANDVFNRSSEAHSMPVMMSASPKQPNKRHLLPRLSEELLYQVFSFLAGREVMVLRCLNRFAYAFLPTCVSTLDLGVATLLRHFASEVGYSAVVQMTNLDALSLRSTASPLSDRSSTHALALYGFACERLDARHDNMGELAIEHLGRALCAGAGRRLRHLDLVATFSHTKHIEGVRRLCESLSQGACDHLERLLLGGNNLGDLGVRPVSEYLRSRTAARLVLLDLRCNYIGEAGYQCIMGALAQGQCRNLGSLCLGGNMITSHCLRPLTDMLLRCACPCLRFLGLEDNYLTDQDAQTILRAGGSAYPMLELSWGSLDANT